MFQGYLAFLLTIDQNIWASFTDDNSVLDIEEIKTDLKGHKEVKLAEAVGKVLVAKDVLDDDESEDAAKKDLDESIGTAINNQKNGKQKYAF